MAAASSTNVCGRWVTPNPNVLIETLQLEMFFNGIYSMLLAREIVWSTGSTPPAGESLTTRTLVIGLVARRLESMSRAIINKLFTDQRTEIDTLNNFRFDSPRTTLKGINCLLPYWD